MKKNIKHWGLFILALLPMALCAQTQTENYVKKIAPQKPVTSTSGLNSKDAIKSVSYFDGLGRGKQNVLIQGGAGNYGNNFIPYDWSAGSPTNSGFYNLNGSSAENQIINGTTPFGHTDLIWECIPDGSGAQDGGWVTDHIAIDKTKAYRYSVWIKKSGNLTDGHSYHGVYNMNNLDGTYANPGWSYFWYGDLPQIDTWYLMVGYIHPAGYTGGDLGISGIYDTSGNKIIDGIEYEWQSTAVDTRFRTYFWLANNTSTRQYMWSPLVQKIDGSEIDLSELISTPQVINNEQYQSKDVVTHISYDDYGRQVKDYLPYASNGSDGSYKTNALTKTNDFYKTHFASDMNLSNPNPYSEKVFENSPLNRVVEQTAPGEDWLKGSVNVIGKEYFDGHSIKMEYEANGANEVRIYSVSTSLANNTYTPTLQGGTSYYSAGYLHKTITKDENWSVSDGLNKTTEEFKNKQGQVILKRTYNSGQAHDTYYVYDDFGNLTYVLPPKVVTSDGVSATELGELGYQYKYDHRNRLVEKKIPGKGWEYIVYDKLDRPVFTQDANLRTGSKWLFTKYDKLGRVAYTGNHFAQYNGTRLALQGALNVTSSQYVIKLTGVPDGGWWSANGISLYYNNTAYNVSYSDELHTINYYDTYVDLPSGFTAPTSVYGQTVTTNTQGLATVSKVRVLDPSAGSGQASWITTVTYYDQKGRPVYVYSQNDYLQTTDIIESNLDFTGKVIETKTTHKKTGKADIVTFESFEYDHQGRLIEQIQKVNSQLPERIVRNNYDDLGQLTSKLTGNGTQKGYKDVTSGITINNDVITKTGTTGWNEGLGTLGSIQGDGYVEFVATVDNRYAKAGLATSNTDASHCSINFAIFLNYNNLRVYEDCLFVGTFGAFSPGEVFRVERIGNKIYYKRNGDVFYISEKTSTATLYGDASFYNSGAQIKDFRLVDNSKGLQNVDYNYNVRGWLTDINQDAQSDNDLFNFTLRYNNPTSGTALFNGNISQTSWNTLNTDSSTKTYTYSYDALNRITSGIDNTGNYNLTAVSYDKNGNILNLQRQGHTNASATTFGVMDNLAYTYDSGNKLTKVLDSGNGTYGFKDGANLATEYTYDANGNMKIDQNKGIASITYNHLNLPTLVYFSGGQQIEYVYDATGVKLEKKVTNYNNGTFTEYAGNYVYEKIGSGTSNLQFFNHPEGYVKADAGSFSYVYQYKDHLGNVRLSYADTNNDGTIDAATEIIEESNYYPFGLKHKGYNNVISSNGNSVAQKFGYQGVELNESLDLNLMEMPFRQYDPAIARFTGIDPMTHYSMSPYVAYDNNPVYWRDPSGADAEAPEWLMEMFNKSGSGFTQYTNTGNGSFEQTARASDEDIKNGKAIIIAFPDQNPDIPSNQKAAQKLEQWFGDGDGKMNGAGHAGIVLIDGETGLTRYFDFGRYNRPDVSGSRGKDEGAVRSSANYRGLSIPNWDFNKTDEQNMDAIVTALHKSSVFKGYGTIMASLAEGLDYKAMLKYAEEMETKGYHNFGGYHTSTNTKNATYCAKFVRGVAGAGGFDWSWYVLTGKANVEDVNRVNKKGIKTIKD